MKKQAVLKPIRICLAMMAVSTMLLSGCGAEEDVEPRIVVVKGKTPTAFAMATATLGDVVSVQKVTCSYQPQASQDVVFKYGGKKVTKVYVEQGDKVEVGQLLMQLGDETLAQQIDSLEYEMKRYEMLIKQAQDTLDYQISSMWVDRVYNRSRLSDDDFYAQIAKNEQNTGYTIEGYQDKLLINAEKLSRLKDEYEECRVYSDYDGTVSWMQKNLIGTVAETGTRVMTVVQDTSCLFAVTSTKYKDKFEKDKVYDMKITSGNAAGNYKVIPYDFDNWGNTLYFEFAEDYNGVDIPVNTSGSISIVLDERKNVIKVPPKVVHEADGKKYVYVVNENNLRTIRWVTIGLSSLDAVEIVDGLKEGEQVILR